MIDILSVEYNRALAIPVLVCQWSEHPPTLVTSMRWWPASITMYRSGANKSFAFPFRFGKYIPEDSDGHRYTISRITTFWWITLCMYNAPAQRDAQDVAYIVASRASRDSRERILSAARNSNSPGKEERLQGTARRSSTSTHVSTSFHPLLKCEQTNKRTRARALARVFLQTYF